MCNIKHNNKYKYINCEYTSLKKKVKIFCDIHGTFSQLASKHLKGQGCKKCADDSRKTTKEEFILKSNIIHNNKYKYNNVVYINTQTKVMIDCELHGWFLQTPNNHLKKGCPKCNRIISKMETDWLDSLNIDNKYRHKTLNINNKYYHVDALVGKVIYEFYGDYWHGNPLKYDLNSINNVSKKTFSELYKNTIDRENILISNGYHVISIWESDFLKNK